MSRQLTQLVAARVLQGVGGAMLLPVGRLAVLRVVPRQDFLAAMSFVTIPGLIGPLVGPTLGGWLVQVASWHWIFLINLPLGVVGGVAALRLMPDLRQPVTRFDMLGYVLLAFGMVAVSMALNALSERQPQHGVGRRAGRGRTREPGCVLASRGAHRPAALSARALQGAHLRRRRARQPVLARRQRRHAVSDSADDAGRRWATRRCTPA